MGNLVRNTRRERETSETTSRPAFCVRRYASRGFTLLEILITILLLGVSVCAVSTAFSRGMFAAAGARDMSVAVNIARGQMERIWDMDYDDISSAAPAPAGTQPPLDEFQVAVTVTQFDPDIKQVDVNVSW
ncbi:MAG: prepilin-type N-terminal cleavage/methylation domain-containing protein [Candidatus Omnitrophica bacterium]|nr:prepilin-type N-terminal cleavage/methylation domain-containing protein [Candidatus Omnitrophota bacterium]